MITTEAIKLFKEYLINDEKSKATVNKYLHDVVCFQIWSKEKELNKATVLSYKACLCESFSPASVNAALSSLNSFFNFMEWYDLRVKSLKIQRQMFTSTDKELTKEEYLRLLNAAKEKKNERLYLLMQTICSTGIRVSEVKYITVEAVSSGVAQIDCKGKRRKIFLPKQLCQLLKDYIREKKIKSCSVFITKQANRLTGLIFGAI